MKKAEVFKVGFLLILFFQIGLNGISQVPDSLYKALHVSNTKSSEALALSNLGNAFINVNTDSARLYLQAADEMYDQINPVLEAAVLHDRLSRFYHNDNDVVKSEEQSLKAIRTANEIDSVVLEIRMVNNLNERIYLTHNLFEEALEPLLKLKEKAIRMNDDMAVFKANESIYNVYFLSKTNVRQRTKLAAENLELSEQIGDEELQMVARFDMALAYGHIGELDSSFNQYVSILRFEAVQDDEDLKSRLYNNMGSLFRAMGQLDSAALYFGKAFESAEISGRIEGMAASKLKMGTLMGAGGDLEGAYENCFQALELFREARVVRRQDACLSCLYEASKGLGNFEDALSWYEQSLVMKDSFVTSNTVENIKRVENQFLLQQTRLEDSLILAETEKLNNEKLRTKNAELKQKDLEKEKGLYIRYGLAFLLLVIIFVGIYVYKKYKDSQEKKREIELAHSELAIKNKEITDSINYAKRIQDAILVSSNKTQNLLKSSFILYLPKDIVAGDFYWFDHVTTESDNDLLLFAAADCTGHGVPGAMVSVVCNNGLNRSVRENGHHKPAMILESTRQIVVDEFGESHEEVKDGMDIALCALKKNGANFDLEFAGANNPLWVIRKGNFDEFELSSDRRVFSSEESAYALLEVKPDKQPVGKHPNAKPFTNHTLSLKRGDRIYIFSDGFIDQFGGQLRPDGRSLGKKFKASNFRKLLLSIQNKPMSEQKTKIQNSFEDWKGELEQLDDICVVGVECE